MNPLNDIDELFISAQLVAANSNEAVQLVKEAVKLRNEGDERAASDLIIELKESLPSEGERDFLADRQLSNLLDRVIPTVYSRLSGSRRIAVRKAFKTESTDTSERSIFLYSVKRAIALAASTVDADSVGEHEVGVALERFLGRILSDTPTALKGVLESKYGSDISSNSSRDDSSSEKRKTSMGTRIAAGMLLILLASAVATWITIPGRTNSQQSSEELFREISSSSFSGEPAFRGSQAPQLERFVADRLGRSISVPRLEGGSIVGVSIVDVLPDLELPVLIYSDLISAEELAVYVLDYQVLSALNGQVQVDRTILRQIARDNGLDIQVDGQESRLVWRHRDDIYVTVTTNDAQETRNRFVFD